MADFKIKPSAGTGNKLLVQSQDQSGSSYAVEIGDAGALKLGTVTAGTLGSAVTGTPALTNDNITGQHAFSVHHNGSNQTLGTASQWTKWENNTADLDSKSGLGSHGYEVQTGGAGYWVIIGQMQFGATFDSSQSMAVGLYKNTTRMSDLWLAPQWDGADNINATIHCVMNLAVGDDVYMYGWHNGNTSTVIQNGTDRNTILSGFKLMV